MTSPDIQKDNINALALETTKLITEDIGDDFFAILADESRDVSVKEKMGVVLRYVDGKGIPIIFSGVHSSLNLLHLVNQNKKMDLNRRNNLPPRHNPVGIIRYRRIPPPPPPIL
ncbi:hypothetical protein LINPERPRIM_LOCUS30955 [Linum perenne]